MFATRFAGDWNSLIENHLIENSPPVRRNRMKLVIFVVFDKCVLSTFSVSRRGDYSNQRSHCRWFYPIPLPSPVQNLSWESAHRKSPLASRFPLGFDRGSKWTKINSFKGASNTNFLCAKSHATSSPVYQIKRWSSERQV